MGYTTIQLGTIPAEAYLHPENFDTMYDNDSIKASEKYQEGLRIGKEFDTISISIYSIWTATMNNRCLSSCETIGYHAYTQDLLRGFLDSGCRIIVYRRNSSDATVYPTTIQESTK